MTVQEMISEIRQLSFEDRLELLDLLTHTLLEEKRSPKRTGSSLHRVRGLLASDDLPPADVDLREAYTDYLMKKDGGFSA
jgi:hypothetical protein